jgi:two-component system cell cycle sensor histidine kinase/response regulator CckA
MRIAASRPEPVESCFSFRLVIHSFKDCQSLIDFDGQRFNDYLPGVIVLSSALRVLILEDDPSFIRLFTRKVQTAPVEIDVKSARNRETMIHELELSDFDCAVIDFSLPDINGIDALKILKDMAPETPAIVYTGSVGEEKAVACMKEGAADFLLKANSERLVPAILAAVKQKREREARLRAEEGQKQSEARFRALAETSTAAIFIYHDNRFSFVNSVLEKMTGYTAEELLSLKVSELVHPDYREMVAQRAEARSRGEDVPARYEFKITRKDGQERWIDFAANSTTYEGMPAALGVAFDVTERKKIEEDRRISELKFRTLVERSLVGVYAIQNNTFVYINPVLADILGYEREELLSGIPVLETVAEANRTLVNENIRKLLNGEIQELQYAYQGKRKDGTIVDLEAKDSATEWDGKPAVIGTLLDTTERNRALTSLRQSEEKYRDIVTLAPVGIFQTTREGRFVMVNQSLVRILGYDSDEELLRLTLDSLSYEGGEGASFIDQLGSASSIAESDIRWRRKDGKQIWVQLTAHAVKDNTGEILYLEGFIRDITGRKEVEQIVRRSEENYRSLFECAREVIFTLDPEGKITALNPSFERATGWKREVWIGRHISEIIHPDDFERAGEEFKRVLKGGPPTQNEFRVLAKSSEYLVCEIGATVQIRDGAIIGVLGTARDITNQKRLEQELRHIQKMESIGTLAGGIAHDFNNILNIVAGYASLAEDQLDKPDTLKTGLEMIRNASDRGATLVRQLLTFARKSDVVIGPVDLNTLITDLVQMLRATFPKTIEIETMLGDVVPSIEADQDQLHQALLNLAVNSRDAMPDGGSLRFSTGLIHGDELRKRILCAQASEYAHIAISDTGIGMDEDTKTKVFEPFFTTKQKGTGLGLSVVYGTIWSHNGFIEIESAVGRGTTMHVYLPISLSAPPAVRKMDGIAEIRGGTECILVVEDEYALRDYLKFVLEERGYRVLEASNGIEAIDVYSSGREKIALVISDLGMPKLDGLGLLRRIFEINPAANIILASGYIEAQQRTEILRLGARHIFQKPYHRKEILLRVREILDAVK